MITYICCHLRQGLWEGGSAGTSVRGPESQEGAGESLKGPNSLGHIIYFDFFGIISTQILNHLSPGPQSSLAPHCKISLGDPDLRYISISKHSTFVMFQEYGIYLISVYNNIFSKSLTNTKPTTNVLTLLINGIVLLKRSWRFLKCKNIILQGNLFEVHVTCGVLELVAKD